MGNQETPSKILLDELFAAEDDQFLDLFGRFSDYTFLKNFANRWIADRRDWARTVLIRYIDADHDQPGHEVVVKRLFKHAEQQHDTELLVHFMVAFDRNVRRSRIQSYRYDWQRRQSYTIDYLFARPNRTVHEQTGRFHEYKHRGQTIRYPLPDIVNRPGNRLFTQATRAYLRRRVWRYFRHLSYRDPEQYVDLICKALSHYRDGDFAAGESILDNWSLMHACYYHSNVIRFNDSHTNVTRGESLAALSTAPYQPKAWETESAGQRLWNLLTDARSMLVRLWTIETLRQSHQQLLQKLDVGQLVGLLSHPDATVQEFAVELFSQHAGLATLGLDVWLQLVDEADFAVLSTICDAMKQHVDEQRLSDQQLIQLACARPVPVARLGFDLLRARHDAKPISRDSLPELSEVRCQSLAKEIANWALGQISRDEDYDCDRVIGFFDSLSTEVRAGACEWMLGESKAGDDPKLWAKLAESPMDDVRFTLVELLRPYAEGASNVTAAKLDADQLGRVWSAVVLCVDRGSRAKPKAIRQLAAAIEADPTLASKFLPVIGCAARSIRAPERSAALAALAWLMDQHDELRPLLRDTIPELEAVDRQAQPTGGGG